MQDVDHRVKPGDDGRLDLRIKATSEPRQRCPYFFPYAAKNTRVALAITSRMRSGEGAGAA